MSNLKTFKDIIAWQKSHELVLYVYKLNKKAESAVSADS